MGAAVDFDSVTLTRILAVCSEESGGPEETVHLIRQRQHSFAPTMYSAWEREGQPGPALAHAEHALALSRAAGHRRWQTNALNAVGWFQAQLGNYPQALTHCQQALTLQQQDDDREGQAATWDSLGYAHHHLDHHAQAVDCYRNALDVIRDLGDRYQEAITLTKLGDTHHAAGNPDVARATWQGALAILTDLDHPDAETVRGKLHTLDEP